LKSIVERKQLIGSDAQERVAATIGGTTRLENVAV
jgi:hypothetical protein